MALYLQMFVHSVGAKHVIVFYLMLSVRDALYLYLLLVHYAKNFESFEVHFSQEVKRNQPYQLLFFRLNQYRSGLRKKRNREIEMKKASAKRRDEIRYQEAA